MEEFTRVSWRETGRILVRELEGCCWRGRLMVCSFKETHRFARYRPRLTLYHAPKFRRVPNNRRAYLSAIFGRVNPYT